MQTQTKKANTGWYHAVTNDDDEAVESMIQESKEHMEQAVDMLKPVMYCAKNNKPKVLSVLLKHGAGVDGFDVGLGVGARYNSLMNAAMAGHAEVCEILLRDGKVNPNFTAHGRTALLLAAHYHHLTTIKVLHKYGADMNARTDDGSNAILETSRFTSHPALIDYLVSNGVACDIEDTQHMTASMHLANIGDVESIKILVEKGGALLSHVNAQGDSVLSIAERRKMSEVVFYCWKRGLNPTNVAMQCHLGELNVTRPRASFPISGRYNLACAAVGSKIYVYGGQAMTQPADTPTIQGTVPPELEIVKPNETEKSSSFEPVQPENAGRNNDGANEAADEGGGPPIGDDDGDGEDMDPLDQEIDEDGEELMNRLFMQFFVRLNEERRANGVPLASRDDAFPLFLEALMGGQIDIAAGLAAVREGEEADEDDMEDSDDEIFGEQQLDPDGEEAKDGKQKKKHAGNMEDAEEEEEDNYDEVDEQMESERSSGSRLSAETFVMDLDECRMDYIFPNPQLQPNLQKIKLRREKKGKWVGIDDDGLGGFTINPPADASFPPCLAVATHAFSAKLSPFGYFELHVLNPGPRRLLTLGLVPPAYPVEGKQPGWLSGSFGLHGDDGAMFHESGSGYAFSDRFEKGDVIGCGVYWPTREVFFAVNGRFTGYSPTKASTPRLYACVGIRNEDTKFRVNFGAEPFRFDFRAPTITWRKILPPLEKSVLPRVEQGHFAKEPTGKYLVLLSVVRPTSATTLFDLEHNAYIIRDAKGLPPAPLSGYNDIQWAQPTSRSCFVFGARSKTKSPVLGLFDTQESEWCDIGGRYDEFVASKTPQAEFAANWLELISALDSEDFQSCSFMAVDGQLMWTGKTTYVIVDPINGIYSQQPLKSKSVRFQTQDSKVNLAQSVVTFGGWDGVAQSNDISVFNSETATWYTPSYTGVIPRPRNAHGSVKASTRSPYFGLNASDLPGGLTLPEPQTVIVNICGWGGRNVMPDIDIFSFSNTPSELAFDTSFMSDLVLHVRHQPTQSNAMDTDSAVDTETITFSAHKIILYCRSSKFKEILTNPQAVEHQVPPGHQLRSSQSDQSSTLAHLYLSIPESTETFKGLLQFLYSDTIPRDPEWLSKYGRSLALLVDLWAPELSPKLLERLLLNRSTLPSTFGSQMQQGFENPLFSDLVLEVEDDSGSMVPSGSSNIISIPVHKVIITTRSPYFKALCTGGMAEASQASIRIPEVPVQALKLVLEFLYTYEVPYDRCSEHIVDMFVLSCRFQISKLKSTLENLLIFNLASDNVVGLLLVAHSQTCVTLLKECISFIKSHKEEMEAHPDYIESAAELSSIMALYQDITH